MKFDVPRPSRPLVGWVAVQFALVAVAIVLLLMFTGRLSTAQLTAAGLLVMVATLSWGALFERRRWAWALESVRLGASAGVLGWVLLA